MWVWTKHAEDEWRAKAKAKGFNVNLRRAGREVKIAGETPMARDIMALQMRGLVTEPGKEPKVLTERTMPTTRKTAEPRNPNTNHARNLFTQSEIDERWVQIENCVAKGMTMAPQVSAAIGIDRSTLLAFIRNHPEGHINPFGRVQYDRKRLRKAIFSAGYTSIGAFDTAMGRLSDVHKIDRGAQKQGNYLRAKKFADALGCEVKDITKGES